MNGKIIRYKQQQVIGISLNRYKFVSGNLKGGKARGKKADNRKLPALKLNFLEQLAFLGAGCE
jgi:hypothetical protein